MSIKSKEPDGLYVGLQKKRQVGKLAADQRRLFTRERHILYRSIGEIKAKSNGPKKDLPACLPLQLPDSRTTNANAQLNRRNSAKRTTQKQVAETSRVDLTDLETK